MGNCPSGPCDPDRRGGRCERVLREIERGRVRSDPINSTPGFIFDLDGVLWHGTEPIPGACEAVARLLAAEYPVLFATNNSSATVAAQEAKLGRFGIDAAGRVLSSAMAAASLIKTGERVFVLGGAGINEAVHARGGECVPVTAADAGPPELDAVIVGLDFDLSYDRLADGGDRHTQRGPLHRHQP